MLKEKIYDYFLEKEKEAKAQKEITFAPSYFNACRRQIFYKKTGIEPSNKITESAYFKMALGDSSHVKIQQIISDLKNVKMLEYEKEKTIDFVGLIFNYRVDGIIEINNEKYILEIKTIYGAGFKYIENEPKKEHLLQMYLYMNFEKIRKGILLYVGRDNGFMVEYIYDINQMKDIENETRNKIKELKELKKMIEGKKIPDRDYQIVIKNNGITDTVTGELNLSFEFTKNKIKYKSDWQCNYCQWRDLCWKEELEKIKNYKFYIGGKYEA